MIAAPRRDLVLPTRAACALTLLLAVAAHADVIRVPQDYLHLQVAVNNAVDGDVILVAPGTYPDTLDIGNKALTVIADGGGTVTLSHILVHELAEGQTVVLRGIGAAGSKAMFPLGPWESGLVVLDCAGRVVVESAAFTGYDGANHMNLFGTPLWHPSGWNAVEIEVAASVELLRCTLNGGNGANLVDEDTDFGAGAGGNGLVALGADVGLHECTLQAGSAGSIFDTVPYSGSSGGSGAHLSVGRLYASGCTATGTGGGSADCDLFSCGAGGPGGDGLAVSGAGSELWEHANTLAAGKGGSGGGATSPKGADGKPVHLSDGATHHPLHPAASSLQASSPVREGHVLTLTLHGKAGDAALAWVSPSDDWLLLPKLSGVLLVDRFAPDMFTLPLGAVAADGSLSVAFTIPELGPGVQEATLFVQGVFAQGAQTRLGSASAVVLLDASY